jgi:hypothetical protein
MRPPLVHTDSLFHDIMSAHEVGHATLGIAIGLRVEAV